MAAVTKICRGHWAEKIAESWSNDCASILSQWQKELKKKKKIWKIELVQQEPKNTKYEIKKL